MLFFGYIVSSVKYSDLNDDIVQTVSDLSECNNNIPKLIIGLNEAKEYAKLNGFDFNILNNTYPNGDMWTFKKTEKREYYERDIEQFKNEIVKHQEKDVVYNYINVFKLKYNDIKRLYDIIFNNSLNKKTNYYIVSRNMLYYPIDYKNVIGLSFTHLKYIGIEKEKIIEKIRNKKFNKIYYTTSKNMRKLTNWFSNKEYVIASIFERNAKNKLSYIYIL